MQKKLIKKQISTLTFTKIMFYNVNSYPKFTGPFFYCDQHDITYTYDATQQSEYA